MVPSSASPDHYLLPPAMKLFLSRDKPCDTTLTDEQGRQIYTITTSGKVFHKKTSIVRVCRGENETRDLADSGSVSSKDSEGGMVPGREIARLQWGFFKSSTLEYNCQVYDIDSFLQRVGPMKV